MIGAHSMVLGALPFTVDIAIPTGTLALEHSLEDTNNLERKGGNSLSLCPLENILGLTARELLGYNASKLQLQQP